ncbi:metal-dependent hydrolase [bacterium]|nr:metal-dependent hydrolase [bacterium]
MDPLTHIMAGALIGHACAGLTTEPAAMLTAIGAAALPDFDFIARKYEGAKFLKIHHGATHSFLGIVVQSIAGAFAGWAFFEYLPWFKQFSAEFFPLLFIATLSICSHIFLDWIMHNNGLPLLWPFSERRFGHPLILGVNPKTVSHECGERQYLTCFGCQSRGGFFNPVSWILVVPAVLGFATPQWRNMLGIIPWIVAFGYFALCIWFRENARKAAMKIDPSMADVMGFPGRARPDRWLFVRQHGEITDAIEADGLKNCIMRRWQFRKEELSPAVKEAVRQVHLDLTDVIRNLYPVEIPLKDGTLVEFRDLSYLYAEPTEIGTIRVILDRQNCILSEVYQEIW